MLGALLSLRHKLARIFCKVHPHNVTNILSSTITPLQQNFCCCLSHVSFQHVANIFHDIYKQHDQKLAMCEKNRLQKHGQQSLSEDKHCHFQSFTECSKPLTIYYMEESLRVQLQRDKEIKQGAETWTVPEKLRNVLCKKKKKILAYGSDNRISLTRDGFKFWF